MTKKTAKTRDPNEPETFIDMWACEVCQSMYEGIDPPDACVCGCRFFENVCDLLHDADNLPSH